MSQSIEQLIQTDGLQRSSLLYEERTPHYWLDYVQEKKLLANGCFKLPMHEGGMSSEEISYLNEMLNLIAYGKNHFPYILYFEFDEAICLKDVGLIGDGLFHDDYQPNIIKDKPKLLHLDSNKAENAVQLSTVTRAIVDSRIYGMPSGGGLSVESRNKSRIVGVGGTHEGSLLVVGEFVTGLYPRIQSVQGINDPLNVM